MVQISAKEQIALKKQHEAQNFIGRHGVTYVKDLASKEEKNYFEGVLYHGGVPILALISYITSNVNSY